MFKHRMLFTLSATFLLLSVIAWIAPQQLEVALYKLFLLTAAAVAGYWIDRELFPYARPDQYSSGDGDPITFAAAQLRRAIVIGSAMLAIGLGA